MTEKPEPGTGPLTVRLTLKYSEASPHEVPRRLAELLNKVTPDWTSVAAIQVDHGVPDWWRR